MDPAALPLVLLVDVDEPTVRVLRGELTDSAEFAETTAGDAPAFTAGAPGERRPTVVVLAEDVPAPAGLVHSLRPHPADLAVAVVATPATEAELAVLPLLFPGDVVTRVRERTRPLPTAVSRLLRALLDRRAHAAAQASAQQQLAAGGTTLGRQLGERLLGQFLTQAPIGALMLDGKEVIAWNRRAAETLELTEAGILHRPLTDLFPAEDREPLERHLSAAAPPHTSEADAVFERSRADGTSQALRVSAQQVLDAEGRTRTLVLADDVTDRLHAQRRLAERTGQALLTAEVAAAMTDAGPLPRRLYRCVRATAERLGADRVCIWIVDEQGQPTHTSCAEDLDGDGAAGPASCGETERHLVEQVLSARGRHPDTARLPTSPYATGHDSDSGSSVGLPLITGGQLIGVLTLATRLALPGSTLTTLENLADQIAVGIQQDRLLHRLRATTQALERPLLPPRLINVPGFDLAARYVPFGEGLHIGGDFYDAFTAPDGHHVLVLGDVCGKGPAAAAITGLVRHTLWTATQHTSDPSYVLPLVNKALKRQDTPFCTLVYAVLDPTRTPARLRITSAGHPAPLLRRADGRTAPLALRGPLLGVLDTPQYPVHELDLGPGESLVLYTDGFTEGAGARDQREPEDLAALVAATAVHGGTVSNDLVAAMLADARDWWGTRLRDDLAVLALTAVPSPPGGGQER
ncbi:SpoIIE family protein phosphatase [Streptomyces sp. DH12]|uniref:SpoIIE family protein phosphatase n=1 Tax=Streptomyces sp. DH12 TaxID=2857010 RepID=UPI001E607F60|nr:SpoIIE family protein phosphatase [Streptomyces sp. DH12]